MVDPYSVSLHSRHLLLFSVFEFCFSFHFLAWCGPLHAGEAMSESISSPEEPSA